MALTTTTIFLTLAAGAGYKFFEAMRDYRKLQAETGSHGNLFREMPDSPQLGGVKFDFKLSGVCAAGAVCALLAGMMFGGSPKVVEVANANAKPAVELRGSVQMAAAPAPAPAPVVTPAAAPAKAEDERDTCHSQMQDMAASICVNSVLLAFDNSSNKQWMVDEMKKTALTCSRWETKPYLVAGEISGKAVLAGVMSARIKSADVLGQCYEIVVGGLSDRKPQLR